MASTRRFVALAALVSALAGGPWIADAKQPLPVHFRFQVLDYVTHEPVAGIQVRLTEDQVCSRVSGCRPVRQHPEHLRVLVAATDAKGRVDFDLPDSGYGYYVPEHGRSDYLTFSSIYKLGAKAKGPLVDEVYKKNGKEYTLYLVPVSLLKIRTKEQALAAANANAELARWLAAQRDRGSLEITVRGGGTTWQVGYGRGNRLKRQVHVNAFDGTTAVNGRWN